MTWRAVSARPYRGILDHVDRDLDLDLVLRPLVCDDVADVRERAQRTAVILLRIGSDGNVRHVKGTG
jgi:hypothetical protein